MSERIDARGLSCPQPVVLAKKAIDRIGKGTIEILVDTVTSKKMFPGWLAVPGIR